MTKEEFYKRVNKGMYPKYVFSQIKEGKPKKDCFTIVCTASDKILLAKYENCNWHQACFTSGGYYKSQHIFYRDINEDVIYWIEGEPKDTTREQFSDWISQKGEEV